MNKTETWTDPVIEEVRRIRQELLKKAGGDLRALMPKTSFAMQGDESKVRHGTCKAVTDEAYTLS
ncbi:MAG: hypothetical protein FJY92_09890 [Candidatus Hydrogenedentes bacterium]|nr:hypothetical protein [Candidatus Hydrogenedentota bacterium]